MTARTPTVRAWVRLLSAAAVLWACDRPDHVPQRPARTGDEEAPEPAPTRPAVSHLPEAEPNDTAADATRVTVGRPMSGEVSGSDVDIFWLGAGTGTVGIRVESEGTLSIVVERPQNASSWTTETDGATTPIGPLSRATSLQITVTGEGAYVLYFDEGEPDAGCGFAREPDDAADPGAHLSSIPASVTGCLPTPGDIDVFLLPRAVLETTTGFGVGLRGAPGIAFNVQLVEAATDTVFAELVGTPGETLLLPNVSTPRGTDVLLRVSSLVGANEAEPYTLDVRRLPPLNGVLETEPNDDVTGATGISDIGLVNGYIHRPGDTDRYLLHSPETRLVRMIAEPPDGLDLQIQLPGGELGPVVIDGAGAGEEEVVCSLLVDGETGTNFAVFARGTQRTGAEPYLLTFRLFDEVAAWEVEPNDALGDVLGIDRELAGPRPAVAIWRTADEHVPFVSGHTFPPGDLDRFVVEVFADPAAAATYTSITIRLEPNAAADYSLEIVDDEGAAVAVSDTGSIGEAETVALDLPAGRYVARVALNVGDPCQHAYRLTAQQTDFPTPATQVPTEGSGDPDETAAEGSGEAAAGDDENDDRRALIPERLPRPRPQLELPPRVPPDPGPPPWQAPQAQPGNSPPTLQPRGGR